MKVTNCAGLTADEIEEIETELAGLENLRGVLLWARENSADFLPQIVVEIVAQDEFTNDVVVAWRKWFLVFATT